MNKQDRENFVVGCDSGGLFKCSFSSKSAANTSKPLQVIAIYNQSIHLKTTLSKNGKKNFQLI